MDDKAKYVGKEVKLLNNYYWFAEVIDIDSLGWTFKLVKRYTGSTDSKQSGDLIFYNHSEKISFIFNN